MTTTTLKVPSLTALTGRLIDSRMGVLHRTSHEPLRRALSSIPEWVTIVERLNALEAVKMPAPPADDVAVYELAAWLEETVTAGNAVTLEDAVRQAHQVHEHTVSRSLLIRAYRQAASEYAAQLDQAVRDNAEEIYHHLTRQLQDVVNRGREVAGGFDLDADSAIRLGRVEEYQAATQVARDYREFRGIRNQLEAAFGWPTGPDVVVHHAELRWVANPADPEVFEHWRAWVRDGHLVDPRSPNRRQPVTPPWPRFGLGARPDEEAAAWLRFLVTHPAAVPWLPSREDFLAATQGLQEYAHREPSLLPGKQAERDAATPPPALPDWLEDTTSRSNRRTRTATKKAS